jgi:hypothetical protein
MKNKLLLGTLLIGIASLFTSCKDDRDANPTLQSPTSFTVNTPASADQYIQLSADNTVHLTWSQPNYGYTTQATYNIQAGIVQNDGSIKWSERDIKDDDGNVIGHAPDFMSTNYYTCNAELSAEEIAQEINMADGVTKEEQYVDKGFRKIALRVRAAIFEALTTLVPGSAIFSEPVFFNHMASFKTVKAPGSIFLIGNINNWPAPEKGNAEALEEWKLFETEIGNKIYEGTFDVPAGDIQFRFYTKLEGWGDDKDPAGSIGPQKADKGIPCDWDKTKADEWTYSDKKLTAGKGSWKFAGFPGGSITFTVDLNKNEVKFVAIPN